MTRTRKPDRVDVRWPSDIRHELLIYIAVLDTISYRADMNVIVRRNFGPVKTIVGPPKRFVLACVDCSNNNNNNNDNSNDNDIITVRPNALIPFCVERLLLLLSFVVTVM